MTFRRLFATREDGREHLRRDCRVVAQMLDGRRYRTQENGRPDGCGKQPQRFRDDTRAVGRAEKVDLFGPQCATQQLDVVRRLAGIQETRLQPLLRELFATGRQLAQKS